MLELKDVKFGFPSRPDFLGPISATILPGKLWAIVGPNGAGKSTLMRLMAGLRKPHAGSLLFEGQPLSALTVRDRARKIALVVQSPPTDLDLPARDLVLLGRFPHRALGIFESAEDYRVADSAMDRTATLPFADRALSTLSGGEAQRVYLAAALAQEPRLLLLDEPTASLDLQHQLAIFEILGDLAATQRMAIVVVTHDINLAGRFCTDIMLLNDGVCVTTGSPAEVLTPSVLEPVYGVTLTTLQTPDALGIPWVVPVGRSGGGKL